MRIKGLEAETCHLPMAERLSAAADRANTSLTRVVSGTETTMLRTDQSDVYADFVAYLSDMSRRAVSRDATRSFGRIIQPPRTGKTVIASQLIEGSGLESLFLVPSRMLVEQARSEFAARIPDIPIGVYYSAEKRLVEHGVNVATYTSVQRLWKEHQLPGIFHRAALVFADEGHQAMTPNRSSLLKEAFHPQALRIAMTATPDYDEERALCRFFPDLIHEITFEEAIRLDLLAPYRFWLAEVDVNGSRVRVRYGDYLDEDLERIMSEAPFFKAVETYRYLGRNKELSALICCATCRQAVELHAYLKSHRPKGTPPPGLILGNTSTRRRKGMLRDFERGRMDTLINVGVLTQGWYSPRCKLILDLSPSLSRVRAIQKFSRALTKDGDAEARIMAFVPKDLPVVPILPIELFSESLASYVFGTRIGGRNTTRSADRQSSDLEALGKTPVQGVSLQSRYVYTTTSRTQRLEPRDTGAVRAVVASCHDFDPKMPLRFLTFRWLIFRHDIFTGRGLDLLKHLGFRLSSHGYFSFLERYYPDGAAWRILFRRGGYDDSEYRDIPCAEDVAWFMSPVDERTAFSVWKERRGGCFRALAGATEQEYDPEKTCIDASVAKGLHHALTQLPPRERKILMARFGLTDGYERTLAEIGHDWELTRNRIRQLVEAGLHLMRRPSCTDFFEEHSYRLNPMPCNASLASEVSELPSHVNIEPRIEAHDTGAYLDYMNQIVEYDTDAYRDLVEAALKIARAKRLRRKKPG